MKVTKKIIAFMMVVSLLLFGNTSSLAATNSWNGTWSTLKVSKQSKTKFYFNLFAFSGAHTGEVSGYATYKGNTATWKDNQGCKLTFKKSTSKININQTDKCRYYEGEGVTFNGYYKKGAYKPPTYTLIQRGVFKTKAQDQAFRNIVKSDYSKFAENMEMISEDQDKDGLHTKVYSGAVRGLYTIMEGIVMYDTKGHYWGAVLTDGQIHYYTNVKAYKSKLPKTIQEWSTGLGPIVYKSK